MEMIQFALWGVLVICICLSTYFSACETAYSSLNSIRVKNLSLEGNKKAERALANYESFDKILTTILVGNNIVNIASSTLCAFLFTTLFADPAVSVIYATVFMVFIILIFGEITPKTLAKRNSERYALALAGSLHFAATVMTPITWVFMMVTGAVSRIAKNDAAETPSFTEEELVVMIDEIEEEGTLEKRESELIKSAIQFDDIKVSEVCTPRVDVIAVEMGVGMEEMKKVLIESGYSRIPVYEKTIDRIVGSIYAKEFYSRYLDNPNFNLMSIIRPIKFVPESASIATLLNELQKSKIHMAVVLDEFGGTSGLVCMEDILEELVGDIWDESDEIMYPIVREDDGSYTVLGEANIRDVMEFIGLRYDPERFESKNMSGFINQKMEKIPRVGDSIDIGDATIIVKAMKQRRIKEARIVPKDSFPVDEDSI